ncbi:olfactory receptor 5V1-like [Bombina bombina]|uniref:olfactory receptor 5V1-like n=1 Tax=Bombina bombina TaxID=8345 RepID=UPI00235A5E5F|nr:olfactory receptor 5V1-like [Bombina bombina]
MKNQTACHEFLLFGFSDLPGLQLHLFLMFLLLYVMTLTANLTIIVLISRDRHLHTPMYFFLANLACIDLLCSSVTSPQMLYNLLSKRWRISRISCVTQVFFFIFFIAAEVFLLAVMSCDRYIAICRPLHYMQIMHRKICAQLASGVWTLGMIYSLVHSLYTMRLSFCGSVTIHSFFCDLPQLFQITCTDTFINIVVFFVAGSPLGLFTFVITFIPYVSIFSTVIKIHGKNTRLKAFSTCTSHLTVASIFYGTLVFNYFRPNTSYHLEEERSLSVCYTVLTPLVNPIIYSLRNQELQAALIRNLHNMN